MSKCQIANRGNDGMCHHKFSCPEGIYCLCKEGELKHVIECVESDRQKKIVKSRWKMSRVKSK